MCGREYARSNDEADVSMRVVADHIRSTTFLIADGVIPSNEWRGYVLRKIMRRAMRHGTPPRPDRAIPSPSGRRYWIARWAMRIPSSAESRNDPSETILAEEKRFDAVLTDGLPRLEAEIAKALESSGRLLSGDAAFRLYDTFGLPYDFIEDTAATQDVTVDRCRLRQGHGSAARTRLARRALRGGEEK